MAYNPQTWHDLPATDTPMDAARLTVIEAGLQAAAAVADGATVKTANLSDLADAGTARANLKTTSSHEPRRIQRPNSTRRTVSTALTTVALNQASALTTALGFLPANTPVPGTYNTLKATIPFDYGWAGYMTWDVSLKLPGQTPYATYAVGASGSSGYCVRFETDATQVCIAIFPTSVPGFQIYVDDQPVVADPVLDTNYFQNLTFPDHTSKVIEFRGGAVFAGVYVDAQSSVWKPKAIAGPKILLVGDSHAAGQGATCNERGMFQGMADELGVEEVVVDGQGATGFIATHGGAAPYGGSFNNRITTHISCAPDMIVIDGGGQDDLGGGSTSAQTIAAMVTYFSTIRAALPKCKLVLMEPANVPGSQALAASVPYTTHIANYKTALAPYGVHHVDVFTNPNGPWNTGAGYSGHTTGTGNNDIYVGSDTVHYNDLGYKYMRRRLAPRLLEILEGAL